MKQIYLSLILLAGTLAYAKPEKALETRVIESKVAQVKLSMFERLEAEPVSQPKEIRIQVECKKGFKQKNYNMKITVCSADLSAKKGIEVDSHEIKFFHYDWDAEKSSNNMEGKLYCDTKNRIQDSFKLSDFCVAAKK